MASFHFPFINSLRKHPFLLNLCRQGCFTQTQRRKFHTDDANRCLHNKSGSHGVPNINLSNFTCLLVNFGKVLCCVHLPMSSSETQMLLPEKTIFHKYGLFCQRFFAFTDDVKSVRNPVRSADWSTEQLHCFSSCLRMTEFLSLSRRRSSARNVPIGEERGETDVFAGYRCHYKGSIFFSVI